MSNMSDSPSTEHRGRKLKCAVINDVPTIERDGRYYTRQDSYFLWLKEVSKYIDLVLCLPVRTDHRANLEGFSSFVATPSIRIVETPYFSTFFDYYLRLPLMLTNFFRYMNILKDVDAVYFRIPSLNPFPAYAAALLCRCGVVSNIVGNQSEILSSSGKYHGLARFAVLLLARLNLVGWRWIVRGSDITFFLGEKIREQYIDCARRAEISFVSLIREDEIANRKDTCGGKVVRLIFVGRLSLEKGINYLLEAFESMVADGSDIHLVIVGDGPAGEILKKQHATMLARDRVEFSGQLSPGAPLRGALLAADIFVLPSISEGIPKVLMEAMAAGLPLVATAVGGIPDLIKDGVNGVLVSAQSVASLRDGIQRLIRNPDLRSRVIAGGYRFVQESTIEKKAAAFAESIRAALDVREGICPSCSRTKRQ